MAIPITVFSLADVMAKSDAAAMNRRQMQLADMKMQEYQRGQQNETTLANMFAQQRPLPQSVEIPGQPAVQQATAFDDEGNTNPLVRQATAATQLPNPDNNPLGRLEHQSKQFRAMQQQLGERGAGKMAFELGQKADAIDEKIWQYRDKARSERMAGSTSQERQARVMIDQRAEDMLNSGSDPAAVMEWKRTAERQVAEQIFTAPKTHVDPATGTVTTSEVALPEALGGRTSPSSKAKIEYGDRAFDKETGAFAERLDKNKVLNVIQPINVIDRINKITASSPDGLGGLRNTTAGRWFNTAQGASYKASVERLISAEIYDDSGAAISIPEEERARLRAMLSVANTAADYIQIYNEQIKPRWEFAARNVIGSANPKVVAQWQKNSGIDLTGWVKDISTPAKITGSDKTTRRIKSDAEYDSLPSGSMFIGPDGKTRRKP